MTLPEYPLEPRPRNALSARPPALFAHCVKCGKRARTRAPKGGDGSVRIVSTHIGWVSGEPCGGAGTEVDTDACYF